MRDGGRRKPQRDPWARGPLPIRPSAGHHDPSFQRAMGSLIARVLGLDPGEVHADAHLREDFGADFLDLLEGLGRVVVEY